MNLRTSAAVILMLFPAVASAETADDNCIRGVVGMSPEIARQLPADGAGESALFVFIRETGRDSGPPTAVITIDGPEYPQDFILCGSDQMIGSFQARALEGKYQLTARHSPTGTPMKKEGFIGRTLGADGEGVVAGEKVKVMISQDYAE